MPYWPIKQQLEREGASTGPSLVMTETTLTVAAVQQQPPQLFFRLLWGRKSAC